MKVYCAWKESWVHHNQNAQVSFNPVFCDSVCHSSVCKKEILLSCIIHCACLAQWLVIFSGIKKKKRTMLPEGTNILMFPFCNIVWESFEEWINCTLWTACKCIDFASYKLDVFNTRLSFEVTVYRFINKFYWMWELTKGLFHGSSLLMITVLVVRDVCLGEDGIEWKLSLK